MTPPPGLPPDADVVLVVDDDPASLRMLTAVLEGAGYTALVARSGAAAIDLLDHVHPDLILLDAVMPGIDGFETATRIKTSAATAAIPIVFMTGLADGVHAVEGFRVGGADYIRKPLVIEELLARVRTHIDRARALHASLAGLEASGQTTLAAHAGGRLFWCAPTAEPLLAALEPGWCANSGRLPQPMLPAMERLSATRKVPGASASLDPPHGIDLILIAPYRDDGLLVRLSETDRAQETQRLRDGLGLTGREAEVLLWVSYGKPSRVIGDILAISPRTVQKHLERIFEKLGVETRSAATAIAIRQIGR